MEEIEITSNNYNPNIRIVKNHIITFNEAFIYLYNIEGGLLDVEIKTEIKDICIINNNYLIGYNNYNDLFEIIIKEKHLEIKDIREETNDDMLYDFILKTDEIFDIVYSDKNKLLIISYNNHIEIKDIDSLNQKPIQRINYYGTFLLNMNKDLFIAFNKESISLYERIIGTKFYQLLTKKNLPIKFNDNYRRLLKLNKKIIMVLNDDILYLINIKTMKIFQEFFLFDYPGKIDFVYKIKDNIFICKDNTLLEFKYLENQITLINSKNQNILFSFNYLNNLLVENKFPKLNNKIKFNCIKNKNISKYTLLSCYESVEDFSILDHHFSPIKFFDTFCDCQETFIGHKKLFTVKKNSIKRKKKPKKKLFFKTEKMEKK